MNAPALAAGTRPAPALSADLMARLESASRVLLSPLESADVDTWRQHVMQRVCAVFGADQATFFVPGEKAVVALWGLDPAVAHPVTAFTEMPFQGRRGSPEPLLDVFFERLMTRNLRVWDMHSADSILDGGGVAWNNIFHNEVLAPNHMADTNSLFMPMRGGGAHLAIHRFLRPPDPGEHLTLLRVLLPAFEAGLTMLDRLEAHRATLDALEEPLAVFDADGREVHCNAALTRLLACDVESAQVRQAFSRLVFQMRRLGFPLRGERSSVPVPQMAVQTAHAQYTLRSVLLPPGMYGDAGAVLISVDTPRKAPALPTAETMAAQWNLTRREAETALLVAQGLSNDDIAEALFVSRHTVRHHVESIMSKLELTGKGRGGIMTKLLGLAHA